MATEPAAHAGRTQAKEGLDAIFAPKSVVVVGASPKPGSVGYGLVSSLKSAGFQGTLHGVHPTAKQVLGVPCVPDVRQVPGRIDLAVIAVPAAAVLGVVEACAAKGVRGLVVVSAGFREADEEGAQLERELGAAVARHGMRMVGPNCLGVANFDPAVRLDATFGSRRVAPGTTALVTQSGAVGIALMEHAAHVGLGLARFASLGNKTDVSGNDLLLLWEEDAGVEQVLLYLENFGNPRNFVRIARRMTPTKPLLVVKSGRSAQGARAAGSHTGALTQEDRLVDALLDQCGVLRADSVEGLFDMALALRPRRRMHHPGVAIVTNSGGPAILAADAIEGAGLQLPDLAPATRDALASWLPAASHPVNPVDLLASGSPEGFERALAAVLDDSQIGAALAIWTPLTGQETAQAAAIARAAAATTKPLVCVLFGHGLGAPAFEVLKQAQVPVYGFPENAVRSLAAVRAWTTWQERAHAPLAPRPAGAAQPSKPGATSPDARAAAQAILARARPRADGWLPMRDAMEVAQAYGLAFAPHAWVRDADEAAAAAARLGGPVALKLDAPGLVHKTEAGAVRLGVAPSDVASAYAAMTAALRQRGLAADAGLVMRMADPGAELLVGATQDATFGPVVACAAGGIYTELLKDVQVRLAPLAAGDAQRMLGRLRMANVLRGARGQPAADLGALATVLERVAWLAADLPEVLEFEVNPVRSGPTGCVALDARARVAVGRPEVTVAAVA